MCDFPAGWLLMSSLFYSIRISCAVMIMMMIMMIIIVMILHQICGKLVGFQVLSVRYNQSALADPSSFSLSLGRVHRRYPFAGLTAASGRQYLAHNIMHRRSHQSPQCRTLTITRAPASQDGTVRQREKQTIINRESCACHLRVQLEVTLVSNC